MAQRSFPGRCGSAVAILDGRESMNSRSAVERAFTYTVLARDCVSVGLGVDLRRETGF